MKYIAISQPGGPEVLQIREGEIPTIGENEVLIAVKAAGVTGSTMRGRTAAEKQEVAEAHACLDSGQHLGKVVITMTS